nr:unnamed protein product [Haemonchus contortus]
MPNAVNLNRKGCNPSSAAASRRSAAGKQTGSAQQSATFIPSESAIPKVASSPSLTFVGVTPPAKTASVTTPAQANKMATPTAAAAPKPPHTAQTPPANAQTPPATAQTPPAVVSNTAGAVRGAKASSSAIRLEKETQEQVLAAIEDHAGDDDSSALICIQPSQSEVNIDEQKKIQHLPVVKAFNEAEKKKNSQHR